MTLKLLKSSERPSPSVFWGWPFCDGHLSLEYSLRTRQRIQLVNIPLHGHSDGLGYRLEDRFYFVMFVFPLPP